PHPRRRGQEVGLPQVARRAGRDDVLPRGDAALGARHYVIEGQLVALAAILAGEAVAQEHVESREGGKTRRLDVVLQRHDRGQAHRERRAAHQRVVFRDDVDAVEEHRLDRVLPAPYRKGVIAQGTEVRVEHQGRTCLRRRRLNMNRQEDAPIPRTLSRRTDSDDAYIYSERDALVKGAFAAPSPFQPALASIAAMAASERPK